MEVVFMYKLKTKVMSKLNGKSGTIVGAYVGIDEGNFYSVLPWETKEAFWIHESHIITVELAKE